MTELQKALEDAFDAHEAATHEPQGTKEIIEQPDLIEEPEKLETPVETEKEPKKPKKAEKIEEKEPEKEKKEPEEEEEEEEVKPPQSWNPVAREKFKSLPKEVREEVIKRESEVGRALQQSAEARRAFDGMSKMLSQYQGMFTAQGVDPISGTNNVLSMAAMLQGGTPAQKVQVVNHLIRNFGVDVVALDQALSGSQKQKPNPEFEYLNKQLQEQHRLLQEFQQERNQRTEQESVRINGEVEQFVAKHEFASDLRFVMADFMDIAEKQGQSIDLETAYQRALATRPDLQALLNSRRTREQNEKQVEKARKAGVSLPQGQSQNEVPKEPVTMRDHILRAFENS